MKSTPTEQTPTGIMARRGRLSIIDTAQINVAFNSTMTATFYCVPCEYPLMPMQDTAEAHGWWACPLCGVEVTPDEQIEYTKRALAGVKSLLKAVKHRRGWTWLRRS